MENLGAGLAALGVIGPGLGIGILTGMSTAAIGRNPAAAERHVDNLASLGGSIVDVVVLAAAEGGGGEGGGEAAGFQINLFWIVTQAVSFLLFLGILYLAAFRRIGGVLEERRSRIEQGLRDADAARQERGRSASQTRPGSGS